jgi:hypothetical protein
MRISPRSSSTVLANASTFGSGEAGAPGGWLEAQAFRVRARKMEGRRVLFMQAKTPWEIFARCKPPGIMHGW